MPPTAEEKDKVRECMKGTINSMTDSSMQHMAQYIPHSKAVEEGRVPDPLVVFPSSNPISIRLALFGRQFMKCYKQNVHPNNREWPK